MRTPSRLLSSAFVALVLSVSLAACSDDDVEDAVEADITACRTIALADVTLQAVSPAGRTAADYSAAISQVSQGILDDEVSAEVAEAAIDLVSAWAKTQNSITTADGNAQSLITAEARSLEAVQEVCPAGATDDDR